MDESKGKRAGRAMKGPAGRPKGEESSPTAAPEDMWREIIAERLAYNSYRGEHPASVANDVVSEIRSAVKRAQLDEEGAEALEFLSRLAYDVIVNGRNAEVLEYVSVHAAKSTTGALPGTKRDQRDRRERTQGGRARWLWIVESRCGRLGPEDQPLDEAGASRAIAGRKSEAERGSDAGPTHDDGSICVPVPRMLFLAETLKRDLAAVDSQAWELDELAVIRRLNNFVAALGSKQPTPLHALAARLAADCGAFDEDDYAKQRDAFRKLPARR